jgi:predicted aspartyl protease
MRKAMIKGKISDSGSPIIETKAIGSRREIDVEGVMDTGFDGYLCLPITTAVALGLELIKLENSELADGTILEHEPVFSGRMEGRHR